MVRGHNLGERAAAGLAAPERKGGGMNATRMSVVAGLILALMPGIAAAAATQDQTEAVVVTATRTPVSASGGTGSLCVVTAGQIAATAATDIKAALALVPTLVVEESGGPAGVATLSVRGSTPQQVLVLLDGQRVASAQTSFFNLNDLQVPIERVERIEVLPTSASALYGADALGGVVNIITRPAGTKPALNVGGRLGSDGERRLAGGVQFGVGKVGLRADGQLRTGDGYRDNGDFDLKNFSVGVAVEPAPWGLDVRWSSLEREAGVPGPAALPSPSARQEDGRDGVRADFSYLPGGWDAKIGVFSQRQSLRFDDPDPPETDPATPAAPISSSSDNSSHGFEAQWDFDTGRGEIYTLGGEWVADGVESSIDGDHDTDHWGVYAQDQWRFGSWSAVGAIRRDQHSVHGEQTMPSVTVGWEANGWKLWGAWARGYRAPTLDELYRNETFFQGNPELLPETSESYEGGAEMVGGGGRVRVSTFWRSVSDMISWADDDGDLVYQPGNVGEASVSGYEAEVLYRPSASISIPLGYQILSVEDEATGERVPGSVRSLLRAAVQSTGGSFGWSVEYAVTDRGDYQLRDGAWSYAVLNAALAWRQTMGSFPVQVSLRGENLQDRTYETVEGYPQPGRSWFAEVRVGL